MGDATGLGPFLWQLPPSLRFEPERAAAFFELLPRTLGDLAALAGRHDEAVSSSQAVTQLPSGVDPSTPVRHALEPRHASWGAEAATGLLREHDVSMVVSDLAGRYPMFEVATNRLVYVRLHGHSRLYYSGYAPGSLRQWATRARAWRDEGRDVLVYFDNSAAGKAPHDALALAELLA